MGPAGMYAAIRQWLVHWAHIRVGTSNCKSHLAPRLEHPTFEIVRRVCRRDELASFLNGRLGHAARVRSGVGQEKHRLFLVGHGVRRGGSGCW